MKQSPFNNPLLLKRCYGLHTTKYDEQPHDLKRFLRLNFGKCTTQTLEIPAS